MKRSRNHSFWTAALIGAVLLAMAAPVSFAQEAKPAAQTPATSAAPVTKKTPPFKEEELASLLAPVALYPDSVVTLILIASTYPLEVIEANRWVQQNSKLKGDALAKAAEKQPWDDSVQGLCAVPEVLKMMDEKLDWTQKVGDAFLAQQKEVMAMIQTLRAKAKEAGNLKSDEKMKVTTEAAPADAATKTEVIVIESADPQVIYVPTYSPTTIYGYWGYPAYPPYYWPPPVGYPGSGFWYGAAIGISIGYWGGHYEHYHNDWHGGDINIDEINIDRGDRNQINAGDRDRGTTGDRGASAKATDRSGGSQKWSHNPDHRKGVSYRDNATASKFDKTSNASAASRDAYRGRSGGGSGGGIQTSSEWRSGGGASAGTRDVGSGSGSRGASAGTSNLGSSGKTRDLGSSPSTSNRGSGGSSYSGGSRGSSSSAFSGMSSGSRASSYGSRGGMSRGGGGGGRRR